LGKISGWVSQGKRGIPFVFEPDDIPRELSTGFSGKKNTENTQE